MWGGDVSGGVFFYPYQLGGDLCCDLHARDRDGVIAAMARSVR